jgi:hypothetical protein
MQCITKEDMKRMPQALTIRPSPYDNRLVAALRRKLRISTSAVIRMGLRSLAEKEKVEV